MRATDVRVVEIELPELVLPEWQKRTKMRCGCGFARDDHPLCVLCGLAIGPQHVERYAKTVAVEVYRDVFDPARGFWKVGRTVENRDVCLSCFKKLAHKTSSLLPIYRPSRPANRLARINAWRRRQGLPEVDEGSDPWPLSRNV